MVSQQPIRIGIVGAGAVSDYHHVPGIRIDPRAELAAICDSSPELLERRGSEWGSTLVTDQYEEVCQSPDVDAVIIATVEAYNATIAAAAQDRGWAFWDPNALLETLVLDPTKIRPFPAFDPADPQHQNAPFGTILSLDGVHPSAEGYRAMGERVSRLLADGFFSA